jgi:hypothetical protein
LKRFANFGREDGQAVILVVVAMSVLLIGALGLAIDCGQMYAQRQMAQAAADAAAQAGIMSIFTGTNITASYPFGTGTPPIASSACTTTDLRTPCVYARDNGFGGTTADVVTLSFPAATAILGVTLSSATVPALTVTVQRTLNTGLIRMVGGAATSVIKATATAGLVGAVSPSCVYVLAPSAASAFQANNGAAVVVNGCAIVVDSTSSSAAVIQGASVSASAIDVVGGTVINNGGSATPTPVTGAPTVVDPFLSLPALTPASCTAHPTMTVATSGQTLSPGTYCGGISVSNGVSNVTFASGNYIINGGGITFGGGTTSSGSNVMFYLTGTNLTYASVTMGNGTNVTLSAPTSGVYMGVLFFQDRTITSSSNATFNGGATMLLNGSLYFPTTDVAFSNGSSTVAYTAIVSYEVSFAGGASINYDNTGLKTGLFSKSVSLVQ